MAEECLQSKVSDSLASTKTFLCGVEIRKRPLNELEFQQSSIQSCSPTDDNSADTEDTPVDIISISTLNELNNELIRIDNEFRIEPESIQVRHTEENNTVHLDVEPVGIFLETPIIDENNVCITSHDYQKVAAKPKRISDDFFSSDDGDDEKNERSKLEQEHESGSSSVRLVNSSNDDDVSVNIPQADREIVEEDTSSSCSNRRSISNDESRLPPIPSDSKDSTVKSAVVSTKCRSHTIAQGTSADIYELFDNDALMQSMDAIERRDFVEEQKLTGGSIIKNSALVNGGNRLNLEYLEPYRQEIKKNASETNNSTNQKDISTTPTSSRSNNVRLTKSAAKLNLSATLNELCVKYPIKEKGSANSSTKTQAKLQNMQVDKQHDMFLNTTSDDSLSSDKSYNTSSNHSLPIFFNKTNKNAATYNLSDVKEKQHLKEANEVVFRESNAYSDPIPSTSSHNSKSQYPSYCCEDSARAAKRDTLNVYKNDNYSNSTLAAFVDKKKLNSTVVSSSSKSKPICHFTTDGQNSLSSGSSRSSRADNNNFEDQILENSEISLPTEQTENDFDDETWADCEEGSDEEVCTCFNYLHDSPSNCLEDELPSRDVDLSGYIQSVTISKDIFLQDSTSDIPNIHRKRKLRDIRISGFENVNCGTPSIGSKRMALDCLSSPRTPIVQTAACGSVERRTPRSLIPTKDNPPPELQNWITQFQRWSHVERLVAVDRLIEHCEPTQVRHMMKVIEPQFQRDFISLLPKELALQVLSYLDPNDLLRAAQTCRSWRFLCDDNLLWKEKCKEAQIVTEPNSDMPKRGRAGNMPPISSPWKAAYMRQHIIEMNWRSRPIREPKVLKGHDDHVITCLQFYGNRIVSGSDDNTLKVWSAVNGKCLRTLVGHTGGVWSSQMSGNIIISGSTDRTLKVWDMETGQCIHTLQGHTSTVRCMHLHSNKVVSGSRDATLRVWDIEQGSCLHVLVGHLAAVRCVQYDGKLIVSGAYDYMVKVWNPERQECLHTLQGHTNRVYSLQFDGIHVVSGSLDTSIRVWDAETGSCKHTLMGHQSLTSGMELRHNILVSGNADSTVKVWDITTGQCLQTLSGPNKHQSAVTCLQFNSRFVITSSDDGTVKLWDVKTGEFIRNLVALDSGGSGGVVWRIRASDTKLICAVGSRNGTEETKLMVLDFDVDGACAKCS